MAREAGILEALLEGGAGLGPGWVGPGDDCCVLPPSAPGDGRLCLSVDALEEGVHFLADWQEPAELAHRLLAACLSDLAACGALPLGYLLSVAWPESRDAAHASALAAALREAERELGCPLLGGDTDVRAGALRLEATVLGRADAPLLRSTARAGDRLFVSGPLGGAAAVVSAWLAGESLEGRGEAWADAERRFRRPVPRLELGRRLAGRASAGIDLSDGLLPDLERLAAASGLDAVVETARLPIHEAAGLELALAGGEDYELLVAGPPELAEEFAELVEVGRLVEPEDGGGRVILEEVA